MPNCPQTSPAHLRNQEGTLSLSCQAAGKQPAQRIEEGRVRVGGAAAFGRHPQRLHEFVHKSVRSSLPGGRSRVNESKRAP